MQHQQLTTKQSSQSTITRTPLRSSLSQRQPLTAAQLLADDILSKHPIAVVRQKEREARAEIQAKSHELRRLVGEKYRDLISSADAVVTMGADAQRLHATLESTRTVLMISEAQARDTTSHKNSPPLESSGSGGSLGAPSAISWSSLDVVNTVWGGPVVVWRALDQQHCLDAVRAYRFSVLAWKSIANHQEHAFLLPVWCTIIELPNQIIACAYRKLTQSTLVFHECMDALTAICVMNGDSNDGKKSNAASSLAVLLRGRRGVLGALFQQCDTLLQSKPSEESLYVSNLGDVLCRIIDDLYLTVTITHDLFLQLLSDDGPPSDSLFHQTLTSFLCNEYRSYFGGDDANGLSWESRLFLAPSEVQSQLAPWVQMIFKRFTECLSESLSMITTAKQLSILRQRLWRQVSLVGQSRWESLCCRCLGETFVMWDSVFNAIFQTRCRMIVRMSFNNVSITDAATEAVQELKQLTSCDATSILWSNDSISTTGRFYVGTKSSIERTKRHIATVASSFHQQLIQIMTDLSFLFTKGMESAPAAPWEQFFGDLELSVRIACSDCITSAEQSLNNLVLLIKSDISRARLSSSMDTAMKSSSSDAAMSLTLAALFVGGLASELVREMPIFDPWEGKHGYRCLNDMINYQGNNIIDATKRLHSVSISSHSMWAEESTMRAVSMLRAGLKTCLSDDFTLIMDGASVPCNISIALCEYLYAISQELHRVGVGAPDHSSTLLDTAYYHYSTSSSTNKTPVTVSCPTGIVSLEAQILFLKYACRAAVMAYDDWSREVVVGQHSEHGILQAVFDMRFVIDIFESWLDSETHSPSQSSLLPSSKLALWETGVPGAQHLWKTMVNTYVDAMNWEMLEDAMDTQISYCVTRYSTVFRNLAKHYGGEDLQKRLTLLMKSSQETNIMPLAMDSGGRFEGLPLSSSLTLPTRSRLRAAVESLEKQPSRKPEVSDTVVDTKTSYSSVLKGNLASSVKNIVGRVEELRADFRAADIFVAFKSVGVSDASAHHDSMATDVFLY